MASEYPAALFYDFKVTCGGNLKGFKADLSKLAALIADPVTEKFVEALRLYVEGGQFGLPCRCLLCLRSYCVFCVRVCLPAFTIPS